MEISSYYESFKNKAKGIMLKNKLNHYYLKRTVEGKSYLAILFDAILVKFVILFILFVYFYIRTLDILFSTVITIQFLILFVLISHKIKKIRLKKAIDKVNDQVAKKKIYKDLINKTPFEFIEIMKLNLEKCNFTKLQMINERDLDLVGEFEGKKIGIKCFQFSKDYKVEINIVRDFFLTLRNKEFEKGIIITTSSFSEDVSDFLLKTKEHIDIRPIDLNHIIDIMEKAGTYPSKKEIEKIILNQLAEKKKKLSEYRDTVVSKKKFVKYFIIGTVILFFGRITPYQLYYQVVAVILYTLGLISAGNYIVNLLKSNTEDKTEGIF